MRKSLLTLLLFIAPIFVSAQNSASGFNWPTDISTKTSKINNLFGKNIFHFNNALFKGIIFSNLNPQNITPVKSGTVFFTLNNESSFLPSPYSQNNFIAIEHIGGIRSYYMNVNQNKNINSLTHIVVTTKTPLGTMGEIPEFKTNGFNLLFHKENRFIHPLLLLPKINNINSSVEIDSMLIESGIFKQFVYKKAKSVTLPLRKSFDIYVKVYENIPSIKQKQSLKEINILIRCNENKKIVYNNTINYSFIIGNTISGASYEQLYKNYNSVEFTSLGTWLYKSRMNTYTITITAKSYDDKTESFSVAASFR